MVRRAGRNGEALVRCRKCSGSVPSGTEADEPLQASTEGHETTWKTDEKILKLEKERSQTGMPRDGMLKEKREGLQGRSAKGSGWKWKTEASWHNKGLWNIAKHNKRKTEEHCPAMKAIK